uniref:Jacalin-type lectin domain-containing protein n=1 Tax=Hyaloperonospora arabidopsidis (strain Emoy2) TaxID=559515 RepID=M4B4G0_HYAAE
MALRAVKRAIQTALLVQVLLLDQTVSVHGDATATQNFAQLKPGDHVSAKVLPADVQEERGLMDALGAGGGGFSDEDFETVMPGAGMEERPPTAELMAGLGSGLSALIPDDIKDSVLGHSISDSGSDESASGSAESAFASAESASGGDESGSSSGKTTEKAVSSADSGSSESSLEESGSASEASASASEASASASEASASASEASATTSDEGESGSDEDEADLGSDGGMDSLFGSSAEDKELSALLKSLSEDDMSGSDELSDSLLTGPGGSGSTDDLLGKFGGGKGVAADLDMDEFMKSIGSSLGLGLFGGGDPTKPQHKEINDGNIRLGQLYGGREHGDPFSDIDNIKFGQFFLNITLRGNKRLDRIEIVAGTQDTAVNLVHGGKGGGSAHIEPQLGESVSSVEVHWDKHDGKTSIFYMQIITSGGKTVSAGTKTANTVTMKAPPGFQIAGFYGRADRNGIFCLGAIYTKVGVKDLSVTDVMDVPDNGTSDIYSYDTTIRNWLGNAQIAVPDSACYQVRHGVSSKNTCPTGYRKEDTDCVGNCPLEYPVECWRECIPQNNDCMQEILSKAISVAATALSLASMGTFGTLLSSIRTVKFVLACVVAIMNSLRGLMFFLRYRVTTVPRTDIEKMMDTAFMLQMVVMDLPMSLATCMGLPMPKSLQFGVLIMAGVSIIVMVAVSVGEALFGSKDNVLLLLRESGAMNKTMKSDTLELGDFLNSNNATCGHEMRILTNRVISKVHEVRHNTTGAAPDDVRVVMSESPIVLRDIPVITNHCMGEIWANKTAVSSYKTRHLLRKTMGVIINQLITDGTTDLGKNVVKQEKAIEYANMGLFVLSMLDPSGIAWLLQDFVQPICAPSEYIGEIDDGPLFEALGLTTVGQAFVGSYGVWKKAGDGTVKIFFESVDKYDVDVVIRVGSVRVDQVNVPANGKAIWSAHVKQMQDKTLYLDRWRPGLFGLPGTGGGSLLMWVSRSSLGGNLIMHARINAS